MSDSLSFDEVSKVFPDGTIALDSVDLSVGSREIVALVGPSGCGKSTLLRIASGLETCSSGSVRTDGSGIGYVFQDPTLLPWRTVGRNVELFAELDGMPREERRTRAREAMALVGLDGWQDRYPRQLSGGMRMRASLARSIVLSPRIFLFDEPFGALDEMTRERLNDELLNLADSQGFAGLFVTHSVAEAVYLADRVVVMSERPGRIVAEISVPLARPRTHDVRFTAEFSEISALVSVALRQGIK